MKKKTQTFYVTPQEMKMIDFVKKNSEANTNAAVFRKGLYHLYSEMQKNRQPDTGTIPQPTCA